ncbi:MAG: radical SAM protein [Phycisphaeraceae bacterium]
MTTPSPKSKSQTHAFHDHNRSWETFEYVYPVVSRRSRGLSIGINLNPDTICNFDCVYCQVEKRPAPRPVRVDTQRLRSELDTLLGQVKSGEIWKHPRFAGVGRGLRVIRDIAFSGDGEPTSAGCFGEAVQIAVELKQAYQLDRVRLIVITNATLLDRPAVEQALSVLDQHQGEVWAKLDAGTEAYYKQVDRSHVPFDRILNNLLVCGRRRPIVIQTMVMRLHGEPMPNSEFNAYQDRLGELIRRGCRVRKVQLYTVARRPLESYVSPVNDDTLERMANQLRQRLPELEVEWFGSGG